MRNVKSKAMLMAAAVLAFVFLAKSASVGQQLAPAQIVEKSLMAFYYQGDDMKAKISMELISKDGAKRSRVMTMIRKDETEGGNQRYFITFTEPADVRGMTFLVWKYAKKEDDRWIFVPAVDLVKRIASNDSRSSFVGSDFNYEDVSGRDVDADTHTLLREEALNGKNCYVVQSVPKGASEFTKKVTWIDKANFLPLKEEYYDAQGQPFRIFTADKVEDIASAGKTFPTITGRSMKNLKTGHSTKVVFSAITYNVGFKLEDFDERNMRRPPADWLR